jgi:transmembrane sensor
MNAEHLKKYCDNKCNEEELNYLLDWIESNNDSPETRSLFEGIWEGNDDKLHLDEAEYDRILDKIHHKVNLIESTYNNDISLINKESRRKKVIFGNILLKVAAFLLLPVLGLSLFMTIKYISVKHNQYAFSKSYNEVFSSVDAITKVSLPDGTSVWLNHNSKLKYPSIFEGDNRTVELTGEGYFEVVHNSLKPFIVRVGEIQVVATGTTFNILGYPGEDKIETSLIEGKVILQNLQPDKKPVTILSMEPSYLAIYKNTNKEVTTQRISDERTYSWKEGKLIFKKEPMGEVVKKLSRWFNIDIQIEDPRLYELTYTATFVHETLPQVLELLTMVTPINYTISNREEKSDGTFTQRKVILKYRKI